MANTPTLNPPRQVEKMIETKNNNKGGEPSKIFCRDNKMQRNQRTEWEGKYRDEACVTLFTGLQPSYCTYVISGMIEFDQV